MQVCITRHELLLEIFANISNIFPGPPGVMGVTGATGSIGFTGQPGPQGPTGQTGYTGYIGLHTFQILFDNISNISTQIVCTQNTLNGLEKSYGLFEHVFGVGL